MTECFSIFALLYFDCVRMSHCVFVFFYTFYVRERKRERNVQRRRVILQTQKEKLIKFLTSSTLNKSLHFNGFRIFNVHFICTTTMTQRTHTKKRIQYALIWRLLFLFHSSSFFLLPFHWKYINGALFFCDFFYRAILLRQCSFIALFFYIMFTKYTRL